MRLITLAIAGFFFVAQGCLDADNVQLELVLHQPMYDLGHWHWLNRRNLESSVQDLAKFIDKQYQGSKYTLVSFQDYSVPTSHNACYRHYNPIDAPSALTKSLNALLEDPYCSQSLSDSKWESSLSAVALTATRLQDTHFSQTLVTKDGKRIVRVLVLVSGAVPYQRGQALEVLGKSPFPADGSGDCSFEPPTMQQVAEIFEQRDMQLLVLASGESFEWWSNQGERWFGDRFSLTKIGNIFEYEGSDVAGAIQAQLCKIASTTTTSTPVIPRSTRAPGIQCYEKDDVQLQLVIHQPMYNLNGFNFNKWNLEKTLAAYKDVVNFNFKTGDLTIVGFEDYGHFDERSHDWISREGCWSPGYPFSRVNAYDLSVTWLLEFADEDLIDPRFESSLSALALTATRTDKLQFADSPISSEGKPYFKVLALIAGARPYLSGQFKSSSPPFAADGSADCSSDAPTLEQFREIMLEKDLHLVVLGYGEGYHWWSTVGRELLGPRIVIRKIDDLFKVPAGILSELLLEFVCPPVPPTTESPTTLPLSSVTSPLHTRSRTKPASTRPTGTTKRASTAEPITEISRPTPTIAPTKGPQQSTKRTTVPHTASTTELSPPTSAAAPTRTPRWTTLADSTSPPTSRSSRYTQTRRQTTDAQASASATTRVPPPTTSSTKLLTVQTTGASSSAKEFPASTTKRKPRRCCRGGKCKSK